MSTSLISSIIPLYKVEMYLSKCVDSVLAQTYGYLEVILVIPRYLHEKMIRSQYPQYGFVPMNTKNYKDVIDWIVSSKLVVTIFETLIKLNIG